MKLGSTVVFDALFNDDEQYFGTIVYRFPNGLVQVQCTFDPERAPVLTRVRPGRLREVSLI